MLAHETACWQDRPTCVLAGIDEAGRGCLAGPVVAAAVVISPAAAAAFYAGDLAGLTDSKQLTARQRDHFHALLTAYAQEPDPRVQIGVGQASAAEIDDLNILAATHVAMRRAVENLPRLPDHALVDGLPVKGLPCPSTAIVKGDAKSLLIAAASVVAKVTRDRLMRALNDRYPVYGFAANKGYGAHEHIAALFRHGPCPEHRRSFRPVQDAEQMFPGFRQQFAGQD